MGIFDIFKKAKIEKVYSSKKTENKKEQESLKEQMFAYEREYIAAKKDVKYDFFGYLTDPDQLPIFIEANTKKERGEFQVETSVSPLTPKMLRHCVMNLTVDARKKEAKNMYGFVRKCHQLAEGNQEIPMEDWIREIARLIEYVQKPHHYTKEQLKSMVRVLDYKTLTEYDWALLGKQLKEADCLPPSYETNPTHVRVWKGMDNVPRVALKFQSRTTPAEREYKIKQSEVFYQSQDGKNLKFDKEASRVWMDFCGQNIEKDIEEYEQKQKS